MLEFVGFENNGERTFRFNFQSDYLFFLSLNFAYLNLRHIGKYAEVSRLIISPPELLPVQSTDFNILDRIPSHSDIPKLILDIALE